MPLLPQGQEPPLIVIYGLRVKATGEVVYIGKSNNFQERVKSHKKAANGDKVDLPIYRWMRVHDATTWEFAILAETTPENWEDDERAWIAKYRALGQAKLNIDDGGAGRTPYVMSEETKRKLADASRGNTNSLGKPLPPEAKTKVSSNLKRLWQDPEYRQRMSDAHKGKPSHRKGKTLSQETKDKIALSVSRYYDNPLNREHASKSHLGKKKETK